MENDENKKEVVTVENEGGKGNPNHVPGGDPEGKGGQFTSANGTQGTTNPEEDDGFSPEFKDAKVEETPRLNVEMSAALRMFMEKKKQQWTKEAQEFLEKTKNDITDIEYYKNLSIEDKKSLLEDSFNGYDKKKLKFMSDEQIEALLYSEAIVNTPKILNQDKILLEQKKEEINKQIQEQLNQTNADGGVSGIWAYKTVYPKDWKELKESGSVQKKIDYYNSVLENPDAPLVEKAKAKQYLAKLEAFEKDGQGYEDLKSSLQLQHLDEFEEIEAKISEINNKIKNFAPDSELVESAKKFQNKYIDPNDAYSAARKDKAVWITMEEIQNNPEFAEFVGELELFENEGYYTNKETIQKAAKKHFGNKFESMWKSMTPEERNQLIDYTGGGYSKYNRPLRGKSHPGWSGWSFAKGVSELTNAIDKCVWDEDIWVQRGLDHEKMFHLPGETTKHTLLDFTPEQLKLLEGQTFTDNGFYSSGAGKGTGFSNNPVIFNTYCPKGTKMAYMNTKGHYANSTENEMILQRGYEYRISKVEKKGGKFYVDVEVILGSDSSKITDMDELKKIGSKHLV